MKTCKNKKTLENLRKTRKNIIASRGGQMFSSGNNVKLSYKGKDVKCTICSNNDYEEVTSTINKSKVKGINLPESFGKLSGSGVV